MGALFFWTPVVSGNDNVSVNSAADSVSAGDSLHFKKFLKNHSDTVILDQGEIEEPPDTVQLNTFLQNHSPHKATIYSAVLPGLGQVYNRKYWKVPIIYLIGYGFYSGFGLDWGWKYYNDIYKEYRQIYSDEYNKGDGKDQAIIDNSSRIMSAARERRDKIVIWMGILYFANVVDAMADAYFFYYDISDDLSMHISPAVTTTNQYVALHDYSYGVKLSFKF